MCAMSKGPDDRVVYSTGPRGGGAAPTTRCRRCGGAPCHCGPQKSLPPDKQPVRVRRERAGRQGKTVTVASPLFLVRADAQALLTEAKRLCGTGGTLKEDKAPDGKPCFVLELQGDQVDKLVAELTTRGYPAKRSGG
jgi:translation initiation factor 1